MGKKLEKIIPCFAAVGLVSCPLCFLHPWGDRSRREQRQQPDPTSGTSLSPRCSCKGTARPPSPLRGTRDALETEHLPVPPAAREGTAARRGRDTPKLCEGAKRAMPTLQTLFHCCLLWKVGKWTVPTVFLTMKALLLTSNLIPERQGDPEY